MGIQNSNSANNGKFYELYGKTILTEGIAPIPTALFRHQKALNLSFQEVSFICHLLSYRWTTQDPRPSIEKLSELTGVSAKTLHSYKKSLVEKGKLIIKNRYNKDGGQLSNDYDLTPLFSEIEKLIMDKDQNMENTDLSYQKTGGCENITEGGITVAEGCEKITQGGITLTGGCVNITALPITKGSEGGITKGLDELDNIQLNNKDNKLFISSLRSDINNSGLALRAAPTAGSQESHKKIKQVIKHDSHSPAGEADVANKNQANTKTQGYDMPTAKELIAELVNEYRTKENVVAKKGDFAFIGALYNNHGYEKVYAAISQLAMSLAVQEINDPLLYLKGILEPKKSMANSEGHRRNEKNGGSGERGYTEEQKKLIRQLYRN